MPEASVQCIVTSPPFWGLRDYGTGTWEGGDADCDHNEAKARKDGANGRHTSATFHGSMSTDHGGGSIQFRDACGKCGARRVDQQIGLEETPSDWVERLVAVFREARRVLRDDGVMWLEVGDSYATAANSNAYPKKQGTSGLTNPDYQDRSRNTQTPGPPPGVKQKDLVGAPWLLAFALRADEWYLRSDTIWSRPNPMPESVTDRPTKSHSYVFLLTKNARYFFDSDAIREPHTPDGRKVTTVVGKDGSEQHRNGERWPGAGRNARSVWQIATEPTPFAHFATFPQALVERCILAGTSEHGACSVCGAPWRRVTEREGIVRRGTEGTKTEAKHKQGLVTALVGAAKGTPRSPTITTVGWEASCSHVDAPVVPCRVLDPFMGSGTTALVARRLGRHAVGVELNAEYLAIAATRLQQLSLLGGAA
jgi:DNA modification methylase